MQRNVTILVGTIAIAALLFLCVRCEAPAIMEDLRAGSTAALATAGISGSQVSVDGRDVLLTGVVADEETRAYAGEVVSLVPGVRVVRNELTVGSATPATAPAPAAPPIADTRQRVTMRWDGERLTLAGSLPTESVRSDTIAQVAGVIGAAQVLDEIVVDPEIEDRASSEVAAVATQIARLAESEASIVDGEITIRGRALSERTYDEVVGALGARWGEADIAIELDESELDDTSCQDELNRLLAGERIRFAKNSAEIDASSLGLLDQLTAVAQRCPGARIEISGHTDSYGPADWNTELSQLRADAVAGYLIRSGVAGNRLRAKGYGSERPIADNETQSGREQNRRIEFTVEGGASR